jgi:eukaryotic-like serine/threonine-protein kinase
LWIQLYPRDDIPHLNLSEVLSDMGQYEEAKEHAAQSLRLLPGDCLSYGAVLGSLIRMDRLDEARVLLRSAEPPVGDCLHFEEYRYALAFLENDKSGMAQVANTSRDKWDFEFSGLQAQTAAYYGRLRESRAQMHGVVSSARQSQQRELGDVFQQFAAESEALFGDPELAKKEAKEALAKSKGRDVEGIGAVVLALARDETSALSLADDLNKRFPESTLVQTNYLPSVKAQLALNHQEASKALEILQIASPYELGNSDGSNPMFPVFLRGQAYLLARRGPEASAEFQKILDHRGVVLTSPIGALAHLQIARAFALQGQTAKARVAYQEFLTLWKDADPEISILTQAKVEYAKLE